MIRTGLILLSLILVVAIGYWLYTDVPKYALVYALGDEEKFTLIKSWAIFWKGWFFFLPGMLLVFVLMGGITVFFYDKAFDSDYKARYEAEKRAHRLTHTNLASQVNVYKKRAENGRQDLKKEMAKELESLKTYREKVLAETQGYETLKKNAEAQLAQAEAIKEAAKKIESDARQSVRESSQKLRRAEKKRDNATAAFQRKNRALAKLQASENA